MRRSRWTDAVAAVAAVAMAAAAGAQPPGGFDGPSGRGPGAPPGGFRPPPDPIREALDANHDHQLDADEIRSASNALLTLDGNGDGILGHDEIRPQVPPGGPNRNGRGVDRGPPQSRGGRDGAEGPGGPRRQGGPGGPRRPEGADRPGPGGRGQGPVPERFLERLMSFDADGDGKLDRDELRTCAEQMRRPRGGPGGPPGPGPDGGPPEPPPSE